jgi:hypothetical protein
MRRKGGKAMIRKLIMAGMLITFLSATTIVFAEDVFITANGTKYHKEICRLIKNKDGVSKIDKKEALENDYGPCKRCYKESIESEEPSVQKKK